MSKRIVKIFVLLLVIAYIPAVLLVPQLGFLKNDIMAWIIYVICALVVLFILSIFKEQKITKGPSERLGGTEETLKDRSKWYQ